MDLQYLFPDDLLYSENHIWVKKISSYESILGITDYIQKRIGEIIYVELLEVRFELKRDEKIGTIESHIDIFDIVSPLSGRIVGVNSELDENPNLLNVDPYNKGWLFLIDLKDRFEPDYLMTSAEYSDTIKQL